MLQSVGSQRAGTTEQLNDSNNKRYFACQFLENVMTTHSKILAWRIPWTEEPGGLQSRGGKELVVVVKLLSHVQLFATPRTVAYQAPPSMGFSRQEYWSGLPFPSPGDLPNPEIEHVFCMVDSLPTAPPGKHQKAPTLKKFHLVFIFMF